LPDFIRKTFVKSFQGHWDQRKRPNSICQSRRADSPPCTIHPKMPFWFCPVRYPGPWFQELDVRHSLI